MMHFVLLTEVGKCSYPHPEIRNFQRLCKMPTQRGITPVFAVSGALNTGRLLTSTLISSKAFSLFIYGATSTPVTLLEGSFLAHFQETFACFLALVPSLPVYQYM